MLHTTAAGDIIMSRTLNCIHSTSSPRYSYDIARYSTTRGRDKPDQRLIQYENLESQRYRNLGLHREPTSINNVQRIYNERHGNFKDELKATKHSVPHIIRSSTAAPGYRLVNRELPNQDTTMVSQSYNKINPFVTEKNQHEVKHLIDLIS